MVSRQSTVPELAVLIHVISFGIRRLRNPLVELEHVCRLVDVDPDPGKKRLFSTGAGESQEERLEVWSLRSCAVVDKQPPTGPSASRPTAVFGHPTGTRHSPGRRRERPRGPATFCNGAIARPAAEFSGVSPLAKSGAVFARA